MITLF